LWNRAYEVACAASSRTTELPIALSRPDGTVFLHLTRVLPHEGANIPLNNRYVERLVKTLLWIKGGAGITLGGNPEIAAHIRSVYSPHGERAFDYDIMGRRIFRSAMTVNSCAASAVPAPHESDIALGRHMNGCRIGFDLGGSDRKAAAVVDGKVVFSEEIRWDPYFQKDPAYHYEGITDSLKRAAAKLPRVDAIGGSAAGVYIQNEPRTGSLFRGISDADFDRHVRGLFLRIKREWGNIPLEVANDGEVTALAGSMSLNENALLGISMGTSVAAGYCNAAGHITPWLNELAFVPIDFRENAPVDEWSGDAGCAVQYFCQQGVGRLIPAAGIEIPAGMPLPEQLVRVQALMEEGDARARRIYETLGTCFGYAVAYYAGFYEIRNLLLLGRTMSGAGGEMIVHKAGEVLQAEFPELRERIAISTPDEQLKRHGQAIAAASLPEIPARSGE
jgi:predicted NBD/HSP70 family sugar kinase